MEKDNYEKYWIRPDKIILSEVLDRTIDLDYLVARIIREYFDLHLKFDENHEVTNFTKIDNFSNFFLLEMGAHRKWKIIEELRKELPEEEKIDIEKFREKFLRIFEIRNIFAHSKIPKKTDKRWFAEPEKISWEELHKEHKELCEEITPVLLAGF